MMMKTIYLILLITISLLANAQSSTQRLEDIEDKLDMMQFERDLENAIRAGEHADERRLRGMPQQPLPKIQKKDISVGRDNANGMHVLLGESILDMSSGMKSFTVLINYSSPMFLKNRAYLSKQIRYVINCNNSHIFLMGDTFFDLPYASGIVIDSNRFDRIKYPINVNTTYSAYQKLLC